ncbi:SapB/AmfS family lanthipeptide [Amycolatopsis lurida]
MSFVLELQNLEASAPEQNPSPSTNSWIWCFSSTSVLICFAQEN